MRKNCQQPVTTILGGRMQHAKAGGLKRNSGKDEKNSEEPWREGNRFQTIWGF